ncbi:MAG TPA: c-type cytochrome [Pyrinomonadaceae bacterium]|nr:c-type cytochrome [Pyrinomonadaceae bacterium]
MNEHASARVRVVAAVFVVLALVAAWLGAHATNAARDAQAQSNANTQTPQAGQQPPQENPAFAELHKRVAGHENAPAEQVFTNIQVLKGVPAQRFLQIMGAYSRALGVRCDYCHIPGEWEKDDKETKQTARDMVRMTADINAEVKKIKTIAADNPMVNCSTCHRGQPKPAPGMGPGQGPRPDGGPRPQGAPTPPAQKP